MQRPKRKEDEADLLRFQDEFIRNQATPSAKLQKLTKSVDHASLSTSESNYPRHSSSVLSEIKEHTHTEYKTFKQNEFLGGFPVVPRIKEGAFDHPRLSSGKRKSLFAQQVLAQELSAFGLKGQAVFISDAKSSKTCSEPRGSVEVSREGLGTRPISEQMHVEIHEENMEKLSKMSHDEILCEKEKLESTIDPNLLAFIKTKRSRRETLQRPNLENRSDCSRKEVVFVDHEMHQEKKAAESAGFNPYVEFSINKDLPGMDVVEAEKLEWMKDPMQYSSKQHKAIGTAVRFDFDGHVIANDANIPISIGLHHHGEECTTPGYSLDELFTFARSNFLQQRVFALKLLARILEQNQEGLYQDRIQGSLLEVLIDAGLPFLLRWSLDDSTSALYYASIYAIHAMMWNPKDNEALDELMYLSDGFKVFCLKPPNSEKTIKTLTSERKGKLLDREMISIDLVKGFIQIQLLPRLRYLLEVCEPDDVTVNYCMNILSRIALHSTELAYNIVECPRIMSTVVEAFLPVAWSLDGSRVNGFPCYRALRLIRFLCIAGKNLSSKLWRDYDLRTRILRYVALINIENDPNQEEIQLAVESIHIWQICIMHGVAILTTVDVHPFVISLLQRYAITKRGLYIDTSSSITLLAEAMVKATLHGNQQTIQGVTHRVYFEDGAQESTRKIEWNLVSGIHAILLQSLSVEVNQFLSHSVEIPDLRYLSALLSYLSTFAVTASAQADVDKVKFVTDVGSWTDDIILKLLQSVNFERLVSQICQFSDFVAPLHSLCSHRAPSCFPDHGMSIFKKGSRCMDQNSAFAFLMSFTKLLHSVVVVNKQCIGKIMSFLRMNSVVEYCKNIISCSSSARKVSSTTISSVIERQFLYHLVSLVEKAISLNLPGKLESSYLEIYHATAFELFTMLQSNEEEEALDIMINLIFNRKLYESNIDMQDVATRLHTLRISAHSETSTTIEALLCGGMEKFGPMVDVYKKYCFPYLRHHSSVSGTYSKDSFLNDKGPGPLIPFDWLFLPIVSLYNIAVNIERSGELIEKVTSDAITSIEMNLLFLLNLEVNRPDILKPISYSMRYARLLCIFLIGSDVFLDSRIKNLLTSLFTLYTTTATLEEFDFRCQIPGTSSFYDLFCEVLIQFAGCSFGDHTFSNYLLMPLHRRHDVKYRKAFWGEFCDALRCFSMPIKSVLMHTSCFLGVVEEDEELLQLYLKNIISRNVSPNRCPFFYLVAVHHLSHYIFDVGLVEDGTEIRVSKRSLLLLNQVLSLEDESSKSDIILYEAVDPDSFKGFRTFKTLPAYRQLIIENR